MSARCALLLASGWAPTWRDTAALPAACTVVALVALAYGVGQLVVLGPSASADPRGAPADQLGASVPARVRWSASLVVLACLLGAAFPEAYGVGYGVAPGVGYGVAAVLAASVAGCTFRRPSWAVLVGALVLELAVPLPVVASVTEGVGRSPDIIGASLELLVLGSLVWLGSAMMLARPRSVLSPGLLSRYLTATDWVLPVVAASGGVLASYASTTVDPFASWYGWCVLLGVAGVAVGLAPVSRRIRVALLHRHVHPVWLPLLDVARLVAAQAVGATVVLLVPASAPDEQPSGLSDMIGYDLPMHLSAVDVLVRWRPDLIFGSVAVIAATLYLRGVRSLARDGVRWPIRRRLAWVGGCVLLLVATSSGIGSYAPVAFSMAMVQHALLLTVVPCLLVLGHGVSLLTETSSSAAHRMNHLLDCSLTRRLTHPLAAWLAMALVLFGLFPTGLYAALLPWHWAHPAMNVVFLCAGLVALWTVLGHTPPRRLPAIGQLVMVFALMGLHAGFAIWLLGQPAALAPEHYLELPVPYIPDILVDQRRGAILGWATAQIPTILAVIVLVTRWARQDRFASAEQPWGRTAHPRPASEG